MAFQRLDECGSTPGYRTSSVTSVRPIRVRHRRGPASLSGHQPNRGGEPPGLEDELGELGRLDPIEAHDDPAELSNRELHLEDLRALSDQGELFGDKLLESDGLGRLPEIAERVSVHLEGGIARGVDLLHLLELVRQLDEVLGVRSHGHIVSGPRQACGVWCELAAVEDCSP